MKLNKKNQLRLVLDFVLFFGLCETVSSQVDLEKMREINPRMQLPLQIDGTLVQAAGIAFVEGKHLTLYTDVREEEVCRDLVRAFDEAVPQWAKMFGINPAKTRPWHLVGFLVADRERFARAGLWAPDLPEFPAGYNRGHHFWIFPQPGNYYTRHLMLHEGTHAFMQWFLHGSGPAWYSEGMAEWVSLHHWSNGQLQLKSRITNRDDVEYWGRPKLIRKALEAGRWQSLDDVLALPNAAFLDVEHYAWTWAACEFFSKHPASADAFAALPKASDDMSTRFSQRFRQKLAKSWPQLEFDWRQFINEIDYGVVSDRVALRSVETKQEERLFKVQLPVDCGWQATTISVDTGDVLRIEANGRFQVRQEPEPWPCEPGGITIEYYRGRPLGQLMAGVIPNSLDNPEVIKPIPVGLGTETTIERSGILAFRINESPVWLEDNSGEINVIVQAK